jgi:CRP/FNR family cyclic AMP-dependent transcriptional regulator
VHIVRQNRSGEREVVGTLYPSELLGELSLLDDSPCSSSIVAAEDSELIGFFKPDLMDILVTKPQMGCKILLRLAEEMAHILRGDYARLIDMGFPFAETEDHGVELDPTAS